MSKPLDGIRILDLTQFLAGSYCTMIFAGLGAEVIKVERPGTGEPARSNPPYAGAKGVSLSRQTEDDISLSILKRCRNKKAISLKLGSPEGNEVLLKLVAKADVVVENFRPGTMKKLGLPYSVLSEANPAIVYGSLTGFGAEGAYSKMPAFDIVIQAISGAMSVNGNADGPPTKSGIAISDLAGGLFSCIGILSALEYRHKTGKGQQVDVSMLDSVLSMMMDEAPDYWLTQGIATRNGSRLTRLTPFNAYKAKDGHYVISSGSNIMWENILKAMGKEDMIDDERYKDQSNRVKRADEVDAIINAWSENISRQEALTALEVYGIPCAPIREIPEVVTDANFIKEGSILPIIHPTCGEIAGIKAAGLPMRFSACEAEFDKPAPLLGSDNELIYRDLLGLKDADLEKLKEARII